MPKMQNTKNRCNIKLIWAKKYHWFRWYFFTTTTKNVWWQRINSYPFRFFGVMVLPNEEIYDLD